VTQVLRIGVGVGVQRWVRFLGDSIRREAKEKALLRIMVGEEAGEMRSRANMAVEEGAQSRRTGWTCGCG
jgi:hypothetical protein